MNPHEEAAKIKAIGRKWSQNLAQPQMQALQKAGKIRVIQPVPSLISLSSTPVALPE